MSNINRAVTQARRAGHARQRPGTALALRKTLALAQLREQMYPPFTVTRRPAPAGGAGQTPPMSSGRRIANYTRRNGGGRLTPRQLRRVAKASDAQDKGRRSGRAS